MCPGPTPQGVELTGLEGVSALVFLDQAFMSSNVWQRCRSPGVAALGEAVAFPSLHIPLWRAGCSQPLPKPRRGSCSPVPQLGSSLGRGLADLPCLLLKKRKRGRLGQPASHCQGSWGSQASG